MREYYRANPIAIAVFGLVFSPLSPLQNRVEANMKWKTKLIKTGLCVLLFGMVFEGISRKTARYHPDVPYLSWHSFLELKWYLLVAALLIASAIFFDGDDFNR